jgi:hypothetical protein
MVDVWRYQIDGGCCFEESVVLNVVRKLTSRGSTDDSSVGRLNKRSNWSTDSRTLVV